MYMCWGHTSLRISRRSSIGRRKRSLVSEPISCRILKRTARRFRGIAGRISRHTVDRILKTHLDPSENTKCSDTLMWLRFVTIEGLTDFGNGPYASAVSTSRQYKRSVTSAKVKV